jgi:hypothetical protein
MLDKQQIKEHMEVTDSSGRHVGTVDCVKDDQLVLTRSDSPTGTHRTLPLDEIDRIDGDKLCLKQGAQIPQGA